MVIDVTLFQLAKHVNYVMYCYYQFEGIVFSFNLLSHGSSSSSSSLQVVPESSYKFTSTKSPICSLLQLHFDLNYSFNNNYPTNLQESSNSEAPQAFLSLSPQFPQTQQNTPRLSIINKLRRLMMPKS